MEIALWYLLCSAIVVIIIMTCWITAIKKKVDTLFSWERTNSKRIADTRHASFDAGILRYKSDSEGRILWAFTPAMETVSPHQRIDSLLSHLGLVEKTVPGTPEKTVIEKKAPPYEPNMLRTLFSDNGELRKLLNAKILEGEKKKKELHEALEKIFRSSPEYLAAVDKSVKEAAMNAIGRDIGWVYAKSFIPKKKPRRKK